MSSEFDVNVAPSIKLVEVPYAKYNSILIDKPPMAPEVEIVPIRNEKNKLMFLFKNSVGSTEAMPVMLRTDDEIPLAVIRASQGRGKEEKIQFQTDGVPKAFEVYRTMVHPESYDDFLDKQLHMVVTDVSNITGIGCEGADFVDTLITNKKYYYTFRTIDFHGHFSNPTAVYEVEMINDAGLSYPSIKIVNFKKKKHHKYKESFRKVMQVKAGLLHTTLDERNFNTLISAEDNRKSLKLGIVEDSIWDKRFKIRVKSKNTGRMIDFNLKFVLKFEET